MIWFCLVPPEPGKSAATMSAFAFESNVLAGTGVKAVPLSDVVSGDLDEPNAVAVGVGRHVESPLATTQIRAVTNVGEKTFEPNTR
jgi:hypothetical protein